MDKIVLNQIANLVLDNRELLKIAMRQRAKFEGWLKFELALQLEKIGMENVEVESSSGFGRNRADISFFHDDSYYSVELKTSNTNWNIEGINSSSRPITKNINSVVRDAEKLNSKNGVVAFILFPIPKNDQRWKPYIQRISDKTKIEIDFEENCRILEIEIDSSNVCDLMVCSFLSREFNNWW